MKNIDDAFSFFKQLLYRGAIATVTATAVLTPQLTPPVAATIESSPKEIVDQVWQIVNNEFVDRDFNNSDWLAMRQTALAKDYDNQQEAYREIRRMLRSLGDPYTRFLSPAEFELLTNQTSGELSGIGVTLTIDSVTGKILVSDTFPNSPAALAGIRKGDFIVKVDNQLTNFMGLEQVSQALRGEIDTQVSLEIQRGNQVFTMDLIRSQVHLPSVSFSYRDEGSIPVGYIKLDEFSSHAAEQMQDAIAQLSEQNVSAYVLDLRDNPGGLLFASVDIARMWMEKGSIVRTIDRKGGDQQFFANHTALTNAPLAVLVNEDSASASEILAGALKDNKRATIVGSRTFGKGTVQSVHTLNDGSGLAVTMSRYYPPSGINITNHGILPNVQQELTVSERNRLEINPSLMGTSADPQYVSAIGILTNTVLSERERSNNPISISQETANTF
ncbi:MAG: PDZ domain-containing protein [Synechococcaceae cyanobacterium RL_1_2]|nr:PDZ domain-containing protein [Synechococcaceae cyanobacterium RL_1_2]